jgi:hypothetical protein
VLGARNPYTLNSQGAACNQLCSTNVCEVLIPALHYTAGSSRLRLANLEQLSAGCRPAHSGTGAAVLDCFRSSKVTVKDCRVSIKPKAKGKLSKLPAVCKLLHAQGRLHGAFGIVLSSGCSSSSSRSSSSSSSRGSACVQALHAQGQARGSCTWLASSSGFVSAAVVGYPEHLQPLSSTAARPDLRLRYYA